MLYAMRHGPTQKTPGIWLGRVDLPLSDEGRAAAKACLPGAAKLQAHRILSSPLLRARQTAEILADGLGLALTVHPELAEMDLGEAAGRSPQEMARLFPQEWSDYLADIANRPVPGGESFRDLQERTVQFGRAIEDQGGRPLLVTHTGPLLALVCAAMRLDARSRTRLHPRPLAVSALTLIGDGQLLGFNRQL